jgi:hypothetical protein
MQNVDNLTFSASHPQIESYTGICLSASQALKLEEFALHAWLAHNGPATMSEIVKHWKAEEERNIKKALFWLVAHGYAAIRDDSHE